MPKPIHELKARFDKAREKQPFDLQKIDEVMSGKHTLPKRLTPRTTELARRIIDFLSGRYSNYDLKYFRQIVIEFERESGFKVGELYKYILKNNRQVVQNFENAQDVLPRRINAYFYARATMAEHSGRPLQEYLSNVKSTELYNHLVSRSSGYVPNDVFIRDYMNGPKRPIFDKLRRELTVIEDTKNNIPGADYKSGTGWNHFIINGDCGKHGVKSYIPLDYTTFDGNAFLIAVNALAKSGFKGQIKTYQPELVSGFFQRADNIVIHGENLDQIISATNLVLSVLESRGVRIGGSLRQTKFAVAKDIQLPELSHLGQRPKSTSFHEGVADLANELLLRTIATNPGKIKSYDDLRRVQTYIFSENGPLVIYLKLIGAFS